MNKLYKLVFSVLAMFTVVACQNEEDLDAVGYLNFNVDTFVSVRPGTRSIVPDYDSKRLTVQIVSVQGENKKVIYHTDDYDKWQEKGKDLPLKAGEYILVAHSYGFDGKESGFDIPYYLGKKNVTIKPGVREQVDLVCTQANVKVTVNFEQSFMESFKTANAQIASTLAGVDPLDFKMGEVMKAAYFPAGQLNAKISVTNKNNREFSQDNVITENAQPRDHYILNYKLSESGSNHIEVQTDDEMRIYTYTFSVSTKPSTQLAVTSVSSWGNFAFLEGEIVSQKAGDVLEDQLMKFEYKLPNDEAWKVVDATVEATAAGKSYKAKAIGLTPDTEYQARLTYKGQDELASASMGFKTDATPVLPNGKLDDWYMSGGVAYAISKVDFDAKRHFWDSGNKGTSTLNVNATSEASSPVHTPGGKSAKLKSQYVGLAIAGQFAAGSLYAGNFIKLKGMSGAQLNMGRPFTARPTQLTGWFQYSTGAIDYRGNNTPANAPQKGAQDLWSGYIALTNGSFVLDNTNPSSFKDFKSLLANPEDKFVVAYGELSAEECVTSSEWKPFTINLTYKDLVTKPTHVIIVFSSSKYGDYFTGSTSSLLYLDDLELVYGSDPQVVKK